MPEHTTMNTVIHAAFRRDLSRFEDALATFPADSRARADQLAVAWDNFTTQLHHHHEDEETIFFPALAGAGAEPGLIGALEGEHEAMQEALAAADALMAAFVAAPTRANAEAAHAGLARLRTVLVTHLDHEERDLEPIAHAYRDTEAWKAAQKAVRKAHPENLGTFLAWLQDGADPETMAKLRSEIPAPVVFVLSRVRGRHYRREIAPTWA
ncbi:hypothetical protein GON03_18435 [Nocardioides sp. MAH-18]|uniref:Hemerythrin-like domain-containing protein n=1 Tax=Nocardioides agri TaxID=2682843 RepID=A0A6L6XUV6_9ACTN|nr:MULTISPECIES: hemerythrin domain-containing protein [unclassified Nocardioides]MBA2956321.1 hemerythrin domain-containing protein [Nocardioides sp. CGMCC 1.13656]MVQ51164.1 hypothetical protein [Nocardioides sp. MAH-18]